MRNTRGSRQLSIDIDKIHKSLRVPNSDQPNSINVTIFVPANQKKRFIISILLYYYIIISIVY